MKQHVNLYAIQLDAPPEQLSAVQMGKVGLGALAVGLALWGVVEWRNHRLALEVEALRAARGAEAERVLEMARLYPPRPVDAALEAEVAGLGRERDARRRLLGLLSSESLGNTTGFSRHVAGLARRRVEGVWLRRIEIEAGGRELVLAGSAVDPALVPRFLRGLGEEEVFVGSEFRALKILRTEATETEPARIDWIARTREIENPFAEPLQ